MDSGRVIVAGGGVLCAGLFVLVAAAFAVFFACVHVLGDGEEARRADGWAWVCGFPALWAGLLVGCAVAELRARRAGR